MARRLLFLGVIRLADLRLEDGFSMSLQGKNKKKKGAKQ
jgi:hypothetical protein